MVTVHIFVQYNMPTVHYTNRTLEWSHTIPTNAETFNPNDDTQNNQDSDRASTPIISNTSTSIMSLQNETRIECVTELDDRTVQLSMRVNTDECSNRSQQSSASTSVTKTEQIKNSVDNHDNEFPVSTIDNIKALGFSDVDAIKACLRATNGDPDAAVEFLTSGIPPPEACDSTTVDVNRREEGGVEEAANSSSVEIIVIDDTDDEKSETEGLTTPSTVVESSTTVPNVTSLSDDTEEVEAEAINNIKALGFQDSTAVKACLIASKGDCNIAVDYLMNGIPSNLEKGNNDTTVCNTAGNQDKMILSSL